MKIFLNIVKFIIAIIVTVCIVLFVGCNVASSTILSKEFILNKLEENNYYANTYTAVKEDFENYIYQSGLDEEVLENIVTQEKIQKDTETIINNIYDGTNEKIDVTEIENNLNNNINNSLNSRITATQQKAIDEFVKQITEQYKETISHTSFEDSINNVMQKANQIVELGKKDGIIGISVGILLILILSYKDILRGFSMAGVSILASGVFYIFVNILVNAKVKIDTITILNDAISITLRDVIYSVLNQLTTYGYILLGVGFGVILVFNVFNGIKNSKTTENI